MLSDHMWATMLPMTKVNFIALVNKVRTKAFTNTNVIAAWRHAELKPFPSSACARISFQMRCLDRKERKPSRTSKSSKTLPPFSYKIDKKQNIRLNVSKGRKSNSLCTEGQFLHFHARSSRV